MTINFFEGSGTTQPARTPQDVARQLIALSVSKSKDISFVYKELLRAVIHKFSQFAVIDEEDRTIDVKCIHANPDRAIAKLTEEDSLVLPILSVHQPTTKRDDSRQRYKPLIVSEKFWDNKKQRAVRIVSLVPSPIEVEYELTVWAKFKNDLDQITEQIHGIFNPDLEIITPFATNIKLFIQQEQVDPSFLVADREDRILRRTFRFVASTYIPSPKFLMTSTGKIQEFNYEVEIAENSVSSYLNNFEEFMPNPNDLFNASALFGYPIASGNPSSAGALPALVWNGAEWSASDIYVQMAEVPNMLFSASSLFASPISNTVSAAAQYNVLTYNGTAWVASTVTATGTFASGDFAASAGSAVYASAAGSSLYSASAGSAVYASAAGSSLYSASAGSAVYASAAESATSATSALYASGLLGSGITNVGLTSGASLVWNGQVWAASALYLRTSEVPNIITNASALLGSGIVASPVSGAALTYNGSNWVASSVLLKLSDVTGLVMNASALLGSAIAANPTLGAALTWNGSNWAASDTYVKVADIAELTAKVDSVEWGARYYRPDFVKLAYVSQYGTGDTGSEVEALGSSDLWTGTSAYGEIARWFIPESAFRQNGIIDIDITGYFDASAVASVANKTLFPSGGVYTTSAAVSSIVASGITFPSVEASWGTTTTTWSDITAASATRFRRELNLGYPTGANAAFTNYLLAGLIRTSTAIAGESYALVYPKNRDSSALNENSYFTLSGVYQTSAYPNTYWKPATGSNYNNSAFDFVSSIICIDQSGSAAAMTTSSESFSLTTGDKLFFFRLTSSVSSLSIASGATVISKITLGSNISDATALVAVLNADADFSNTNASALNLSAVLDSGKVKIQYMGTDPGYEFGVVGTGARKLGIGPVTGTHYSYYYVSKEDLFTLSSTDPRLYQANMASATAVFEIQTADDPYDNVLDYTDLPYGVLVSTLGYPVYDPSGAAYAGNVNTSTLYQITYEAPPSAVGLTGSSTRGFPQPWTTIATFETGVSSFTNIYSTNRAYFDINIKLRSAGFDGSIFYQPYTIEINQTSGTDVVTKKVMNRTSIDVTKDKMMRVRFKCIQYSPTGDTVYYTDIPSDYLYKTISASSDNVGTYYYGLIPRVLTVTTLGATLTCPGDGHPF